MINITRRFRAAVLKVAGSSGGESLKGKMRVKIKNSSTNPLIPSTITQQVASSVLLIDGNLCAYPIDDTPIQPNGEAYVDYVCLRYDDGEYIEWYLDAETIVLSAGEDQTVAVKDISDLVNCTKESYRVLITDPTIEASCTVEYQDQGQ